MEAVEKELVLLPDEARQLLARYGFPDPALDETPLKEIQDTIITVGAAALANLMEELNKTLAYLDLHRPQLVPGRVWLFGGGGAIRNVASYLTAKVGKPVQSWRLVDDRPEQLIDNSPPQMLASAMALFGPGVFEMKTYINLLPGDYRRRTLIRRRVAQWSIAWGLGLTATISIGSAQYQRYQDAQHVMMAHERAYAPLQFLKDETAKTQKQLAALGTQESILEQLHDDRPPLAVVGLVSRSARQCEGRIRVDQLLVKHDLKTSKNDKAPGTLSLRGTGLDNLAVAKFVVALRSTGAFAQVDLKSSVGSKVEADQERAFLVECQY